MRWGREHHLQAEILTTVGFIGTVCAVCDEVALRIGSGDALPTVTSEGVDRTTA